MKQEFQIGDIVSWGGVLGKIVSRETGSPYPLTVAFPIEGKEAIESFKDDGRNRSWHSEPSLTFVSRPTKKTKHKFWLWFNSALMMTLFCDKNGRFVDGSSYDHKFDDREWDKVLSTEQEIETGW